MLWSKVPPFLGKGAARTIAPNQIEVADPAVTQDGGDPLARASPLNVMEASEKVTCPVTGVTSKPSPAAGASETSSAHDSGAASVSAQFPWVGLSDVCGNRGSRSRADREQADKRRRIAEMAGPVHLALCEIRRLKQLEHLLLVGREREKEGGQLARGGAGNLVDPAIQADAHLEDDLESVDSQRRGLLQDSLHGRASPATCAAGDVAATSEDGGVTVMQLRVKLRALEGAMRGVVEQKRQVVRRVGSLVRRKGEIEIQMAAIRAQLHAAEASGGSMRDGKKEEGVANSEPDEVTEGGGLTLLTPMLVQCDPLTAESAVELQAMKEALGELTAEVTAVREELEVWLAGARRGWSLRRSAGSVVRKRVAELEEKIGGVERALE